jgi:hypothetical protein
VDPLSRLHGRTKVCGIEPDSVPAPST